MDWLQLRVSTQRGEVEAVEESLLSCGAAAVTLEDGGDTPILEPGVGEAPLWAAVRVTGLFAADVDVEALSWQLAALLDGRGQWHWERLEDAVWESLWQRHFQPLRCGQRLWICPSWAEAPEPEAINLHLDPGLAFGSGTHPTTALCLEWLDGQDLRGQRVLDYGCGSGILGLAALLLGARHVIAVDNDPQALRATRDNARRNGFGEAQISACLPEDLKNQCFDLVLANILAAPLIALAPMLSRYCGTAGSLCLSGILSAQSPALLAAYPRVDFDPPRIRDDWVCLSGRVRAG